MSALGRRPPSDWKHVERYRLAEAVPPAPVPGVFGINWYTNFDRPENLGTSYWIGRGDLGSIRGGHAICARPHGVTDRDGWWKFYDQGSEGACVGFSSCRAVTLLNRARYRAPELYRRAQETDEYPDTPPAEGTSVRAGFEILRTEGPVRARAQFSDLADGIAAYRWATSWDEVRSALGIPDGSDGVPLLNSWGTSYPHVVRLDDAAGERILGEDGEFAIPSDR